MNISTKILLAVAVLATLGLGGLVRNVSANQSKSAVVVTPQRSVTTQTNNQTQTKEASDGDGEDNDATEAPEVK
jgi:hypothetical protein